MGLGSYIERIVNHILLFATQVLKVVHFFSFQGQEREIGVDGVAHNRRHVARFDKAKRERKV